MTEIAFVGFGELGAAIAEGLGRSGEHRLRAYVRPHAAGAGAAVRAQRLSRSGARECASLEEALDGARCVISVVPGDVSGAVCEASAEWVAPGALYVDLSAAAVEVKRAGGERIADAGAMYVDGAVLGTVSVSGPAVPILASGPGAPAWRALARGEGLNVDVLDGPVGDASLVKLLRSVYMKGRDALIVEMMLAARRYGLQDVVASSIRGPGEQVPFPQLADRVLRSLTVHAGRRAEELARSGQVVREAGVEPLLSSAGTEVLRRVAGLGLRGEWAGERPPDGVDVLALIDQRSRTAADGSP